MIEQILKALALQYMTDNAPLPTLPNGNTDFSVWRAARQIVTAAELRNAVRMLGQYP